MSKDSLSSLIFISRVLQLADNVSLMFRGIYVAAIQEIDLTTGIRWIGYQK
jgi:hypothetical protein